MKITQEQGPEIPDENASWELDLKKVGFVRRILNARRWYGADWWFVTISSIMVIVFIVVALFPGLFAPYSPEELVGTRFLAPGAHPVLPLLIVPKSSPVNALKDLAVGANQPRAALAVVTGVPTASALNEAAQKIDSQLKNEAGGLRLRPRIDRYPTLEDALQAVVDGKAQGAVVQSTEFETVAAQFPTLREGESITGEIATAGGFLLGTNDIGQDVWSRLLWGTQIALLIGFSASSSS